MLCIYLPLPAWPCVGTGAPTTTQLDAMDATVLAVAYGPNVSVVILGRLVRSRPSPAPPPLP